MRRARRCSSESLAPRITPACRLAVLRGLSEGLKGVRKADAPPGWELFAKSFSDEHSALVNELRAVFGDGRALDDIKRLALDAKADLQTRQTALKTLIDNRPADLQTICETALETRGLDVTAVRGLALFGDAAIAERILKRYRALSVPARPVAIDTLASRPAFAALLLKEIAAGKIARADLTAFQARRIQGFNDAALSKQLSAVWGDLRETAADKVKLIHELKGRLTRDEIAKADLSQGRLLFQGICAACHTLYGEGAKIGPDLTGSGRANLDYLLENIVEPSAVVSAEYRLSDVTMKDGRELAGIVKARTGRTLTLRTLTEEQTVELSEVVKEDTSALSMMPEGLLLALQPEQVRDLIAYLMYPVASAPAEVKPASSLDPDRRAGNGTGAGSWLAANQTGIASLLAPRYRRLRQVGVALPSLLLRQRQPCIQRGGEPPAADFHCELMLLAGPTLVPRHADLRRAVARWFFVHEHLPFAVRSHKVQRKTRSLRISKERRAKECIIAPHFNFGPQALISEQRNARHDAKGVANLPHVVRVAKTLQERGVQVRHASGRGAAAHGQPALRVVPSVKSGGKGVGVSMGQSVHERFHGCNDRFPIL